MARGEESRAAIVRRLRLLPRALGLAGPAELCRKAGIKDSAWSNFTRIDGDRIITRDEALKLRNRFGLSLDWIYAGELNPTMPAAVVDALFQLENEERTPSVKRRLHGA